MTKLAKRERLQVYYAIDDTLDDFCRADCPHSGLIKQSLSAVCEACPISARLREYGLKLEDVELDEIVVPDKWSQEEDDYLISAFGDTKVKGIAEKLDRTVRSVYQRIHRLKKKGLIKIEAK